MRYLVLFAEPDASTDPDTIDIDLADELEASTAFEAAEIFAKNDALACSSPEDMVHHVLVSECGTNDWNLFEVFVSIVARAKVAGDPL